MHSALWNFWGILFLIFFQAAGLSVDGQFNDWAGQPFISDPPGDGPNPNTDVINFYWGTNPGEEYIYWMVERMEVNSANPGVYYHVGVDTNSNGGYNDSVDRLIVVHYDPQKNAGETDVTLYTGTGDWVGQWSGNWGDSSGAGGSRAEWRVSFADLGIDARQAVSMYAMAGQNENASNADRMPDTGDITWTPIPVFGWAGLALAAGAVILFTWLRVGRRLWKAG